MATKRIVLFSDGTGNSAAKAQKTNVWRMFQALDQGRADQIAKYDDGVGTASNRYLAAIGGAFGWGLKRNVLDLYRFVCRNYEVGDDLYGFGFSRGAFTIRVLVDLVATEGLVTFRSEEELHRNAAAAYRHYRAKKFPSHSPFVLGMRGLRDALLWVKDRIKGYRSYAEVAEQTKAAGLAEIPIRFLGLWDTVEAYGVPIGELKRGIDWVLWPMVFGDLVLSARVRRACHALSLDDERTTFHPLLWDEAAEARMVADKQVMPGRITQVWFAGVHSNVGGGYPEDQLSYVSLDWMMSEAIANGLELDSQAVAQVAAAKSPYARLYDSRAGFATYYRYAPRHIEDARDREGRPILPIVHGSVVMRMAHGADRYAPISLPHEFWVLAPDGELLAMEGAPKSLTLDATKTSRVGARHATKADDAISAEKTRLLDAIKALMRPDRQAVAMVWDTVFWRRTVYWLSFVLTAQLLTYPLTGSLFAKIGSAMAAVTTPSSILYTQWERIKSAFDAGSRGPLSNIVDAFSGFVPSYASPWINALKEHPLEFGSIAVLVVLSLVGSKVLDARIHDRAWLAWHGSFRKDYASWSKEAQRGWRNSLLAALVVAGAFWLVALFRWNVLVRTELGLLVLGLLALLLLRLAITPRRGRESESGLGATSLPPTAALRVARAIRHSRALSVIYEWTFLRAVPIAFALLVVVAGLAVANRALFDVVSASGHFCENSVPVQERTTERIGAGRSEFRTDAVCWASGLVLQEGRRYRITLDTPGDWFDLTVRADVAGFSAPDFGFVAATPLKRWWTADWFKPIARIDRVGNDEYLLAPPDGFDKHEYGTCAGTTGGPGDAGAGHPIGSDMAQALMACAPTPPDRRVVVADIKARTTGELFVYVNDAVLMVPGLTGYFYRNNSGSGRISVERITGP